MHAQVLLASGPYMMDIVLVLLSFFGFFVLTVLGALITAGLLSRLTGKNCPWLFVPVLALVYFISGFFLGGHLFGG